MNYKYSNKFERDYSWYLKYKDVFTFDGTLHTLDKVKYSKYGKDAKYCFYKFDSNGIVYPTNEPDLLYQIHKCKGSINFNIKMWAEDRGKGILGKIEFNEICKEFELLDWMINAVEKQKYKYYNI
jgi:hypothetical protein